MNYRVNTQVILSFNGINSVGVITNIRYRKGVPLYDVRCENGAGHVLVPKDTDATVPADATFPNAVIHTAATKSWNALEDKEHDTKLQVKRNHGHTRANYGDYYVIDFDDKRLIERVNKMEFAGK